MIPGRSRPTTVTACTCPDVPRHRAVSPARGPPEHVVQHRLGQPAGEGVLLAGVVAAEQQRRRRPAAPAASAPWPNRGCGRRHAAPPAAASAGQRRVPAERRPGHDDPHPTARPAPAPRRARARRCPARPGSACSAAARSAPRRRTRVSTSSSPSPRWVLVGWLARPTRCRLANSQSPERSPVKIRPVRLAPWAAGARPTTRTRVARTRSRAPAGPSRSSSRNDARLARATSSRQATSRGQAPALRDRASSSARSCQPSAEALPAACGSGRAPVWRRHPGRRYR